MAVVIRLARAGKRNNAVYRLVSQDKARHPQKKFLEHLGNFYPLSQQHPDKPKFTYNKERLAYWLSKGAKCSSRVQQLIHMTETGTLSKVKKPRKKKKRSPEAAQPAAQATAAAETATPPKSVPEKSASGEKATPKNP